MLTPPVRPSRSHGKRACQCAGQRAKHCPGNCAKLNSVPTGAQSAGRDPKDCAKSHAEDCAKNTALQIKLFVFQHRFSFLFRLGLALIVPAYSNLSLYKNMSAKKYGVK
jgi:hypothetical protein